MLDLPLGSGHGARQLDDGEEELDGGIEGGCGKGAGVCCCWGVEGVDAL